MFRNDFLYRLDTAWICLVFFLSIILMAYLGKIVGDKFYFSRVKKEDIDLKSLRSIEAGLFGMFSLLMGFTFNFAANRYEITKDVLLKEANAIGSAIMMTELYEEADRTEFRKEFRIYLESLIHLYNVGIDQHARQPILEKVKTSGFKIWEHASKLSHNNKNEIASKHMIPTLKQLFEAGYDRQTAIRSRLPDMVLIMLYITSTSCVFLAGYTTRHIKAKEKFLILIFATISTLVLFIILDYDRPLRGLITDRISEETMKEKLKLFE